MPELTLDLFAQAPPEPRPICEECNTPMHPYADNDKHGWSCDGCGWSWDMEEGE